MLEKLSERISKIDKIAKCIFKYGLLICLILFIATNFFMEKANSLEDLIVARQLAGVGVYMIAEVVIGAILLDVCIKNRE